MLPPVPVTSRPHHEGFSDSDDLLDAVFAILSENEDEPDAIEVESYEELQSHAPWVLSIEDDDDVVAALEFRLNTIGIELVRAAQGREGYRRAFMEAPHAILLDYELPNGNGDYVLRRLKESRATSDIPVIVLTGRREGAIQRQMLSLGAAAFLNKPFEWSELRRHLSDYLDNPEVRRAVMAADAC